MPRASQQQNDHDLLIAINTRLGDFITRTESSIREHGERIGGKADMPTVIELKQKIDETVGARLFEEKTADHEKRIRMLESNVWKAIGGIAVLELILLGITLINMVKGG